MRDVPFLHKESSHAKADPARRSPGLTVLTVGASATFAARSNGTSALHLQRPDARRRRQRLDASRSTSRAATRRAEEARRPERRRELCGRREHAVPPLDARRPDRRPRVEPARGRPGERADLRRPPGLTRADRRHGRPARRRLRRARPLPGPAALALPRHARRSGSGRTPDAAHQRRQPARAAGRCSASRSTRPSATTRTRSSCSGRVASRRSSRRASCTPATRSRCASAPRARSPSPRWNRCAANHVGDHEPAAPSS